MNNIILFASPLFLLSVLLEVWLFKRDGDAAERRGPGEAWIGYSRRDSRTSILMGLGSIFTSFGWELLFLLMATGLYELTPLRIPPHAWWCWVILLLAEDLSYYWYHRVGHEVRLFWASHVVHHSSQHYNLSTALRQTWVPLTQFPFWLWLPLLGFAPWTILVQQSVSLLYQFWLHTERIGTLPRWFEYVMNTPSHHRVHHGTQPQYLDRNYGGILIIWDRLFRSFEPEGDRVVYGLTKNITTYNPLRVAFGEYRALLADVRRAARFRDKVGHLVHGPAWQPAA